LGDVVALGLDDVFSADIMSDGPWQWLLRMLESLQFDGPGGVGNDLGCPCDQMALMWAMPIVELEL